MQNNPKEPQPPIR